MRILLLLLVGLIGCAPANIPSRPVQAESSPSASLTATATLATQPSVPEGNGTKPPDTQSWLSPGKVVITNFRPGARAEFPLTIHNGNDVQSKFSVYYRKPDYVGEGFVIAPDYTKDWVLIADMSPVMLPNETRDILITLAMPLNSKAPDRWEFWIGVSDTTQKGMVVTEICSRWIITMRS